MLRRLIAICLLILLISANFSRFFAYAGFEVNKSYITAAFCENKSRPWMNCQGKCYLLKKMKQAEENEKQQAVKDNLNRLEVSFFQDLFQLKFLSPIVPDNFRHSFPIYTSHYSSRYTDTIFKPPKADRLSYNFNASMATG